MKSNYFSALTITIALFLLGAKLNAAVFTANPAGGDYNNAATWAITSGTDPDGIPDANDNITIGSGITVTVTVDNQFCNTLNIASGGFLTFNNVNTFTSNGLITLNGTINGTFSGASSSFIKNALSGGFTGTTGNISITGNLNFLSNASVTTGITINNTGNIIIGSGFYLSLFGNTTLSGSVDGVSASSQLQCMTGSVLTVNNQLMPTAGYVTAISAGYVLNNTIIFDGPGAYSLGSTGFENVIIRGSGIKTTSSATSTTINKTLTIDPGATLAQSTSQGITFNGPMLINGTFTGSTKTINYFNALWTNNGTFSHGGIFYFQGSTAKTLTGTGTSNFYSINVLNANVTKSNGTFVINGQLQTVSQNFNNGAGSLTINGFYLASSGGTFTANSPGNSVFISYNGNIPNTTSGYYNLTLGPFGGIKSLASNTIVLNNLTVNASSTLKTNNFNLSVGGTWLNNGTFTSSTGKTVTFNGSAAQTVSNTTGTTTFTGLTINNNAGVTLTTGTYLLSEVLTVSAGTFNTAGHSFTMLSTAAKTARIAPLGGTGFINGNFIIQRFISARDTTYADLASPVQSSTFADWSNELPAISYVSNPPYTNSSAYTYNEASDVYVPVTSSGTALTPGQGFEVYLSGGFTYTNFPATTMNTIGAPTQGDQDLTGLISNSAQGWNLVGNPFASNILWSTIYTTSGGAGSGLYDYIEMYDYTIQDWYGYTSADAIEIGSTQGFWVYGLPGNGPVTLTIPEASKTTTSNSSIKTLTKAQPYFTLTISGADKSNNAAHTFKVNAATDASDGLDIKDIAFRNSPNRSTPALYSMVQGKKININTFNSANDSYSMPLKTQVTVSGNYNIEAAGFNFMPDYTCIKLEDKLLNKMIDLTNENAYSFKMNATDDAERFILHFSKNKDCRSLTTLPAASAFSNDVEILQTEQGNQINFNLSETTNSVISVINLLGQTITNSISVDANNQSVNISLPEGFSGMYILKIESAKGTITKKFVRK